MKDYLKNEIKHIPMMLLLLILFYGVVAFATGNYLFNSSDVEYDNTNSGIQSTNVADAIDELYACASNYSTYNNRLTGVENNKSDKSSTVSTVNWDTTNNKLTKTINGTTSDVVTGSTILNGLTKSQVTTALGYTPPTTDTNTWPTAISQLANDVGYITAAGNTWRPITSDVNNADGNTASSAALSNWIYYTLANALNGKADYSYFKIKYLGAVSPSRNGNIDTGISSSNFILAVRCDSTDDVIATPSLSSTHTKWWINLRSAINPWGVLTSGTYNFYVLYI